MITKGCKTHDDSTVSAFEWVLKPDAHWVKDKTWTKARIIVQESLHNFSELNIMDANSQTLQVLPWLSIPVKVKSACRLNI